MYDLVEYILYCGKRWRSVHFVKDTVVIDETLDQGKSNKHCLEFPENINCIEWVHIINSRHRGGTFKDDPARDIGARRDLTIPDSKVHGANKGPIWGRQDPGGPHVGPMNLAIWECVDDS